MTNRLTIYTASWCPDCWAAKRVLDERGLEYDLVDIEETPEAVDIIVKAMGKRVLPTLEYNGEYIDGNHFDQDKFESDLDGLLG